MVAFCIHQGKNSCLPTLSMTERFQRSLYWEYFLPQLLENGSFPILVASSLFFAFVYGYMFFRACWKPQKVLSHALWGHGKHFPRTCGILLSSREFYKLLVSQYIHNTLFPSWINQEYPLKNLSKSYPVDSRLLDFLVDQTLLITMFTLIRFFHSDLKLKEVRIGVIRDFTVMLTVTNKVEDSAYYSTITLKLPADLDYIGPTQVKE